MTSTLQDRLDQARDDVQTRVQDYPVNVQGFMTAVLWERACMLVRRTQAPESWRYPTYYDLLLDVADPPTVAPIFSDDMLGVMEARSCYSNCYEAVLEYGGYTYVEGIAMAQFMPVRHAWLIDSEGSIVDPTWANLEVPTGFLASYYGVRFTDDFLLSHTVSTGWHSFFDSDWRTDHQILKRGLEFDQAGRANALGGNL